MWKLIVVLTVSLAAGQTAANACGKCVKDECPSPSDCRAGLVFDQCGCCMVCGRLEGEKCDNYTLPLPEKNRYGFCGDNMACLLRNDLEDVDIAEALCFCKNDGAVCGSDGRTYPSVCRMRQEAMLRGDDGLSVSLWTPCETHPTISSTPENVTANVNDDLALSCEARGYPIPSLIWEFESAATGKRIKLPGDDQLIALQVRGGPEPYMVSSWVQILRVRSTDAGVYSCTVVSKKGIVRAEATVTVLKRIKTKPPPPPSPAPPTLKSTKRTSSKTSRKESLQQG